MTGSDPPDSSPTGTPVAGQPHDGLFKGILGRPEHAASELRSILPAGLASRLDLDQLEQVDGSFVDRALRQQHTDVLFRARLDQGDALIYVCWNTSPRLTGGWRCGCVAISPGSGPGTWSCTPLRGGCRRSSQLSSTSAALPGPHPPT
ncbi:hypothetical protein MLP_13690 [Microlunatus phosphovorus NM-1]|uniref:Transposase (putative) YhgA-like domain-containing protein n=1 Tax=Microlunatus phosphovorus (strain ATCC 700054 / DSM 10555 / JCM 9379 / NBRC 101784 / NCIMB 13414 / VKM Ac-1990 / NM-1) TaxID=1032480 RepID=F5XPS5_MICPN|nr:hypothetical protein MLP_13690 [Microlunatus phosphovorus NM-1]